MLLTKGVQEMRFEQDKYAVVYNDTADYMTDGYGTTATFETPGEAERAGIDSGRDYYVVDMFED